MGEGRGLDIEFSGRYAWSGSWEGYQSQLHSFSCFIKFQVSNCRSIRFWNDVCCADEPLKVLLLELFTLAVNKSATVNEYL